MTTRVPAIAAMLFAAGSLLGCRSVPVNQGLVPLPYASQLRELRGIYSGSLRIKTGDGKIDRPVFDQAQLKFDVAADGRASLAMTPNKLTAGCELQFASLEQLEVMGLRSGRYFDSHFTINRDACSLPSNDANIVIDPNPDGPAQIKIRIVERQVPRARFDEDHSSYYVGTFTLSQQQR